MLDKRVQNVILYYRLVFLLLYFLNYKKIRNGWEIIMNFDEFIVLVLKFIRIIICLNCVLFFFKFESVMINQQN